MIPTCRSGRKTIEVKDSTGNSVLYVLNEVTYLTNRKITEGIKESIIKSNIVKILSYLQIPHFISPVLEEINSIRKGREKEIGFTYLGNILHNIKAENKEGEGRYIYLTEEDINNKEKRTHYVELVEDKEESDKEVGGMYIMGYKEGRKILFRRSDSLSLRLNLIIASTVLDNRESDIFILGEKGMKEYLSLVNSNTSICYIEDEEGYAVKKVRINPYTSRVINT